MPSPLPAFNAMTAAARVLPENKNFAPKYDTWQEQAWALWGSVAEFSAAVGWRSGTASRVRLVAAEVIPGADEPKEIKEGPAADAVRRLAGGTGGQAELMKEMTTHLSVPGEGWLVGEADLTSPRGESWRVYSADELKWRNSRYQVKNGPRATDWRPLAPNSLVVRFWNRHPRQGWEADSEARHALSALTELDLINKRIIAEVTSRLAFNGLLLYDKGILSFPNLEQPEGADQIDPFAQMLVDVASRGISNPQSPEATIPIPLGYDLGDTDRSQVDPKLLMQHVKVVDALDDKLLAERDSAVRRLAISLDMPPEILTGTGDTSHWNSWSIDEKAFKLHVAPVVESIANSLTVGYLERILESAGQSLTGPNGGRLVVWYDPTEVTTPPDRSEDVIAAYSMGEVPGRVLRREIGLNDEQDKPTPEEYREWLIRYLGRQKETAASVLEGLGGMQVESIQNREGRPPDETEEGDGTNGPPSAPESRPPSRRPGNNNEADAVTAGLAQPDLAQLELTEMSHDDLNVLTEKLTVELARRNPPASTWYDSTIPVVTRVTPRTRNGKNEQGDES